MPSNKEFKITGHVFDRQTRRDVSGLRVEAWDKDTKYHDLLGVAITDPRGKFIIEFNELFYGDYGEDLLPDVFFRIYRRKRMIHSTEDTVLMNLAKPETGVEIAIDVPRTDANSGRDLIKARYALRSQAFVRNSDVKGVKQEGKDRLGILKSAANTWWRQKAFSLDGLRPPATGAGSILKKDVYQATTKLADQGVTVKEVRPYDGSKIDNAQLIRSMGKNIKAGDEVVLYEENGTVKYYEYPRTREGIDSATARDVDSLISRMTDVESVSDQFTTQQTDITSLRGELTQLKTEIEAKDAEILQLRQDSTAAATRIGVLERDLQARESSISQLTMNVETLDKKYTEFTAGINLDRIARIENDVQRLKER